MTATPRLSAIAPRKIGKMEVHPVGLGCQWRPGSEPGVVVDLYSSRFDRQAAIRLLRRALDRGVTLFDTAEAYGPWLSEDIVGEALEGRRDGVVLCTKFGMNIDPSTGQRSPGMNSRPEHVRQVVHGQLKRLRTDRIDLLYQHRVDPAVPIEDVAGVVKDLIVQGKVRMFGMSEPGPQTVRRAHAVQPVSAIQNEYSMLFSDPAVLPLCEELGITLVSWGPLGMAFLAGGIAADRRFEAGAVPDFRSMVPRFAPESLPANMALVGLVRNWAARKSTTPAALALAWVLAQKPYTVVIPGTTNPAHMEENLTAASVTFTPDELDALNAAVAAIQIRGDRLPDAVLRGTGVEAPARG